MYEKKSYSQREKESIEYPHVEGLKVGYPKIIQKVVEGKVTNVVEFTCDDERDNYEVNDFALQNLLAAGVDLKPMVFNDISLKAVDALIEKTNSLNLKND